MELSVISDTLTTVVTSHGLGFSKYLLNRNFNVLSSEHQQSPPSAAGAGVRQISAALAPPPVKYNKVKSVPRRLTRKTKRIKRRLLSDDGDDENGVLFDGGYYDGPFGGGGSSWSGGGGGGGKGWNYGGSGGANWEESSSFSDPAFDFVYELMCWAALSNCLHFAFKKMVRIVADGFSDPTRDKVPVRLTSVY